MTRVERSVTFATPMAKANWLDAMATLDARLPLVREMARRFVKAYGPNDQTVLARAVHRWVRDSIRYVGDGVGEELSDSQQIIERGAGDCDDKARLFVTELRAMKIRAGIVPIFEGPDFVHVQARAYLNWPVRRNTDGVVQRIGYAWTWVPAELIVRGVELGQLPPRGRLLMA